MTYCAHDSMSRAGTRVSSPAQRPTMASTPSAPMTILPRHVAAPCQPREHTRPGAPAARRARRSGAAGGGAALSAPPAATPPAGPAPTTSTSTSGIGHRERAHGAGRDALPAPRAAGAVDHQVVELEVNGFRRTQRQAQPAAVAYRQIHHRYFGRLC